MDSKRSTTTAVENPSGRRGRPPGTSTLETSTLVARLKTKMGVTAEDFAPLIGVREKTVRNYISQGVIPVKGETRQRLEKLAIQHGETVLDEVSG